jgi:RNA polymerase sigma-70 factor (ECF subfamily)
VPAFDSFEAAEAASTGSFPVTEWTVIVTAREHSPAGAIPALERLARAYWRPLFSFLRCRGFKHADAADAVQGFFDHLLRKDFLKHIRPREGKFRTFLLTSLCNWLNDQHDRASAQKRGGNVPGGIVEWDGLEPEVRSRLEPIAGDSPEMSFDRCWAQEIVSRAFDRVRESYKARGRLEVIEQLGAVILAEPDVGTYARVAEALGVSDGAVRKMVFDLRAKFGALVREEVLRTVRSESAAQDEIRHLIALLRQ